MSEISFTTNTVLVKSKEHSLQNIRVTKDGQEAWPVSGAANGPGGIHGPQAAPGVGNLCREKNRLKRLPMIKSSKTV
ncbi:hypothetical protein RRG08_057000 [Elysia crispata]|uniref:Uncharacterized protein n=1 Tax=Elysia crispata TaxID=231223 RepID=A0AAE1DAR6_9GAST|nr:hypothetical protein RRG08_057000 [Elysia crispata]